MGEFELAAPLIVLGIPFQLLDKDQLTGPWWRLLRFLHNPFVTAIGLEILFAFWDMGNQMALGLQSAVLFLVLPGAYLALGVIVWMQSLSVFPAWPNLRSHFTKAVYVWAMEMAMMIMGTVWFWSGTNIGPIHSAHRIWGLTGVEDLHLAGMVMIGSSLPTMCLVIWHFWQWIEDTLRVPEDDSYGNDASHG
jgi:cytochrome c oxidase assembly factor CtaG